MTPLNLPKAERPKKKYRDIYKKVSMLAYDISTLLDHDIFMDYSPHLNLLTVRVYLNGWASGARNRDADFKEDVYFSNLFNQAKVDEIIRYLEKLLK